MTSVTKRLLETREKSPLKESQEYPCLRSIIRILRPQKQSLWRVGFIPGTTIVAGKTAPGGDPQVFRVDGGEIALRRETSRNLLLKLPE